MTRTEKKCFIGCTALHGLLVLILFFGSALMPHREEPDTVKKFTVYDSATVSAILATGGGGEEGAPAKTESTKPPDAAPAAAPANPTPPAPPAATVTKPIEPVVEPTKPTVEEKRETPKNVETPKAIVEPPPIIKPPRRVVNRETPKPAPAIPEPPKPSKIAKPDKKPTHSEDLDPSEFTKVKRSQAKPDDQAREAAAQAAAQNAANAARRQKQREVAQIIGTIGKGLSSSTLVKTSPGYGGGGVASVNYRDVIFNRYYGAWVTPLTIDSDVSPVQVRVTIGRDGRVISARILKPSGNRAMDKSVSGAIENVTFIEPFPAEISEPEMTVTIEFSLEAKRQTG